MNLTNVEIYNQGSKPFGLSFGEWSVKWWQWLLSIKKSRSPARDLSGKNAFLGQTDSKVLFLCQTIEGTRELPTREISIRSGTSLFLPIINWISNFYEHGDSEEELVEIATTRMSKIGTLDLTLNGNSIRGLEKYRFPSSFFTANLPKHNILDLPEGNTRFVSDGYWVFTKPIIADLTIRTFGSCSSGVTKIGVNYFIKVV